MKPLRDLNHYEVLEIPQQATYGEIQRAYEIARRTYGKNAIASYPLFGPEELEEILKRIEEAYRTLIDPGRRERYDQALFGTTASAAAPPSEKPRLKNQPLPHPYGEQEELSGKDLKQLRESRGIELAEIADQTRISLSYLTFLEEDRFQMLPPEVYLRSYLLQYARAIGFESKAVSDRYFTYLHRHHTLPPSS